MTGILINRPVKVIYCLSGFSQSGVRFSHPHQSDTVGRFNFQDLSEMINGLFKILIPEINLAQKVMGADQR